MMDPFGQTSHPKLEPWFCSILRKYTMRQLQRSEAVPVLLDGLVLELQNPKMVLREGTTRTTHDI